MKAARQDAASAEPILLNDAALEQALDVFLPEGAADTAATPGAGADAADLAESLFASETQEGATFEVPLSPADSERPWRTYSSPTADDTLWAVEPPTNQTAHRAPGRVRTWTIAAVVAIGLAGIASVVVQQRLTRRPSGLAAATPATPPGEPLEDASRDARAPAFLPPVTGAVLEGSLTPDDSTPPRTSEVAPVPPREAVTAPHPLDAPRSLEAPRAAAAPVRTAAPSSVPPAEPMPLPQVAETAPAPAAPTPAVREAAPVPIEREPLPAPAPTVVEPAVSPVAADTASIETVLSRYRQAFTSLDADAARAVWPAVDARTLGRAFDQLAEQQIEFQSCAIVVNGTHATAACDGRARYIPKVGSRSVRDEPRRWTFSLQKADSQWVIERVASR